MKTKRLIAITRQVSPAINQCELTHLERKSIDYKRACTKHKQYEDTLRSLGIEIISLEAEPDLPDSVFVEDVALVLDDCAIMLNPGASSRRSEVASVEKILTPYREIFHIQPPGTADGGDVLTIGRTIYIGISSRSTEDAVEQIKAILEPRNLKVTSSYQVHAVRVTGCLHLKSAVTQIGEDTLLINPEWVSKDGFPGMQFVEVDPSEPYAANALLVDSTVIYPSSFPRTRTKLEAAGIRMIIVDADELAKAEGAVTCCSLIFSA